MTVPSRLALAAAVILTVLMIGMAVEPAIGIAVAAGDIALVLAALAQGRALRRQHVTVERDRWSRFQIDRRAEFIFRIDSRASRSIVVRLRQPWPEDVEGEARTAELVVEPGEAVRVALAATPRRRGRIEVPPAEIDIAGRVALARRRWSLPAAAISVYPDLTRVAEFDVLRRHHGLQRAGVHRIRMVGAGREFEQLRDYVPDDDYRDVNWKATARHRSPITTVYRHERSQDVVLCLDAGRMMGDPVGEGTALDRAVDASLMLAQVSMWQGDRVGLMVFRDTVARFLKPRAGKAAMARLVEELVDTQPEPVFPSYAAMVAALRAGQRRRSMVFLFTDLNDPQLAEDLARVLPLAGRRHLVVVVGLRDPLIDRVAGGAAADRRELHRVLAARKLASDRAAHRAELGRAGVQVLASDADALTLDVINRYLEIKMRQLV